MKSLKYILILFLAAGCTGAPPPPDINPFFIFNDSTDPDKTHLYVMPCRVKPDYTFGCRADESSPLNRLFLGYFMVSKEEVAAWRAWSKDLTTNYECKKK